MIWTCHGILSFFIFIFMFRNNAIREQLGQNNFRRCYGFFRKYHSESTWSRRCSKFSINNYEGPWQRYLKDTLQLKILCTSVSSLHQDIELIIVCFSFTQTSLVFKFNLMLIEQFLPQFIYLSIFWYCILKFIQYLYAFFIRASKFSWASVLFFVKVYSYKMLLYFLFSMKH